MKSKQETTLITHDANEYDLLIDLMTLSKSLCKHIDDNNEHGIKIYKGEVLNTLTNLERFKTGQDGFRKLRYEQAKQEIYNYEKK